MTQGMPETGAGGLVAVAHAQLIDDFRDVVSDAAGAQPRPLCDLRVREAEAQQFENRALAGSEELAQVRTILRYHAASSLGSPGAPCPRRNLGKAIEFPGGGADLDSEGWPSRLPTLYRRLTE